MRPPRRCSRTSPFAPSRDSWSPWWALRLARRPSPTSSPASMTRSDRRRCGSTVSTWARRHPRIAARGHRPGHPGPRTCFTTPSVPTSATRSRAPRRRSCSRRSRGAEILPLVESLPGGSTHSSATRIPALRWEKQRMAIALLLLKLPTWWCSDEGSPHTRFRSPRRRSGGAQVALAGRTSPVIATGCRRSATPTSSSSSTGRIVEPGDA